MAPTPAVSLPPDLPVSFKKLLVANRGEIACRIALAARKMKIPKVAAIYVEGEESAPHVSMADEKHLVGQGVKGYLDAEKIVKVAKEAGADCLHPGYGFLSESPVLAGLCQKHGIVFIGPRPETLSTFGDKVSARHAAVQCGVPVMKGTLDPVKSSAECVQKAKELGMRFPIVLKAVFGGGGRGMRKVESMEELETGGAFERCSSEAATAFGAGDVFMEEFMTDAKHIEIQILGDGRGNVLHLCERDCTVQRRNQKVIEMAPAFNIHPKLRERIAGAACALGKSVSYLGAGTVEFLVHGSLTNPDAHFIFLEVNPRLQVEHTVTEEALGVDIVRSMTMLCDPQGKRTLEDLKLNCTPQAVAIQSRVCWSPLTGSPVLSTFRPPPESAEVRIDGGVREGMQLSLSFDPMIVKLIVRGKTHQEAMQKSEEALKRFEIGGVASNVQDLLSILGHPVFKEGDKVYTSFMAQYIDKPKATQKSKDSEFEEASAPLAGTVLRVLVKAGSKVKRGASLVVIESMKTETEIPAPASGKVVEVLAKEGTTVRDGEVLVKIKAEAEEEEAGGGQDADNNSEEAPAHAAAQAPGASLPLLSPAWYGDLDSKKDPPPLLKNEAMVIPSFVDSTSEVFKKRRARNLELCEDLKKKLQEVDSRDLESKGIKQHLKRKKLFVRERVKELIDPGSQFLELSALAAYDMYDGEVHSAGSVAGIGLIKGKPWMILVNDSTIKGGTVFPMGLKKNLRAQEIATWCRLPCCYLVDSGGAFLPLQAEIFPEVGGKSFANQARLSALGLPQIAAVLGMSTAGGAYVPAMCEEVVMVKRNGTMYLGGPPLVKAATGEDVTEEELGGADMHTSKSGTADNVAKDEKDALKQLRRIAEYCHRKPAGGVTTLGDVISRRASVSPRYPSEELLGIIPEDNRVRYKVREVIARLVDGSRAHEFKPRYGSTLVTCMAHIGGFPVGILANNGPLTSEAALKATHFIQICGNRHTPLLFLQNISGFMVGKDYEQKGITKDGAKMVRAVSCVRVPKLTVIIGGSHGAGNYGMCGRAYDPNFMFMWPNAQISVMGGPQAADVLVSVKNGQRLKRGKKPLSEEQAEQLRQPILDKFKEESSAYFATARLWDDGVIDPRDTRSVLARCLSVCMSCPLEQSHYGIFRM